MIVSSHLNVFNCTCIVKPEVEFPGRGDNTVKLFYVMCAQKKKLRFRMELLMVYDLLNYFLIK